MKTKRTTLWIRTAATLALAVLVFLSGATNVKAYPGKVTTGSAKVRASADTNSDTVGSLKNGDSIDILSSTTDANGQVWYQVNVIGGTGYIRGDLVETSGGDNANTSSSSSSSASSSSSSEGGDTSQIDVTNVAEKAAYVNTTKNSNIRSGPGTGFSTVSSVAGKTNLTITGEATDSSGTKWYRVRTSNGTTGFMRADLITEGSSGTSSDSSNAASSASSTDSANAASSTSTEAPAAEPAESTTPDASEGDADADNAEAGAGDDAEAAEGEGAEGDEGEGAEGEGEAGEGEGESEAPAAAAVPDTTGQQYTVVYENQTAWLHDNNANTRVQVEQLLSAASSSDEVKRIASQNRLFKILSIIFGILAAILLVLLILSTIRFRRYVDEEYMEEDEEDEAEQRRERLRIEREERERERERERAAEQKRREAEAKEREAEKKRIAKEAETAKTEPKKTTVRETVRPEKKDVKPERKTLSATQVAATGAAANAKAAAKAKTEEKKTEFKTAARDTAKAADEKATTAKHKVRNFVAGDNDDMEFEFLNVDDD